MEEGSLLQEALDSGHHGPSNTLTARVYWVDHQTKKEERPSCNSNTARHGTPRPPPVEVEAIVAALELVKDQLYERLQALVEYPWFHKAPTLELMRTLTPPSSSSPPPPPAPQPHSTTTLPFLQAHCNYGLQVTDEWQLIHVLLQYSCHNPNVAMECWDGDDGSVLLVQAAHALPEWVDQLDGRHRCWIYQGQVRLIPPLSSGSAAATTMSPEEESYGEGSSSSPPLSSTGTIRVDQALHYLATATTHEPSLTAVEQRITHIIEDTIHNRVTNAIHTHRAAVFVPRSVATVVLQQNPQLVNSIVHAFLEQAHHQSPPPTTESDSRSELASFALEEKKKWVWTTHTFGRTQYAMLRHTVSPNWPSPNAIPTQYQSAVAQNDTGPTKSRDYSHLQHGVAVGVRLVAGLEHLLQQQQQQQPPSSRSSPTSGSAVSPWPTLIEQFRIWQGGAAAPTVDLNGGDDTRWGPPAPDQVDGDDWLQIGEDDLSKWTTTEASGSNSSATATPTVPTNPLDAVLEGVQSFFTGKSDWDGVETSNSFLDIDPTVVLKLLYATLQAPTADALILPSNHPGQVDPAATEDPFFSAQDYRDLDDDDSSSGDSQAKEDGDTTEATMRDFMHAMDAELKRSISNADEPLPTSCDNMPMDDETAESIHLLTNMLRSLESASDGTGPFQSMLQEMGIAPPDVR